MKNLNLTQNNKGQQEVKRKATVLASRKKEEVTIKEKLRIKKQTSRTRKAAVTINK